MLEKSRHKTAVIVGTLSQVPNYPKKLKIYLNNASPYWQAVYWDKGKTYRRSLKTTDKRSAYENAKEFYEQIIVAKYSQANHLAQYQIKAKEDFVLAPESLFKQIVSEWLSLRASKWTTNHTKQVEQRLVNNVIKYIAYKNIQKITRKNLLELLQRMEERGAYALARRVLNDCRQIWQYAIVIGACKEDITVGLNKALHSHSVVHFNTVSANDLPQLMIDIANYNKDGDLIVKYALQLMALTFVRKNELLQATWDEFDIEKAIWKIPANHMKMRIEHVVPLSKQAIAILKQIRTDFPNTSLVFHKMGKLLVGHALIYALYWMGYKHRMTIHGFRALASTILNEHGFRADAIERQLAHVDSNQVRRAYNRAQYMEERIDMMAWWGNHLEKITTLIS